VSEPQVVACGFVDLDAHTAYSLWQLRQQVFVIEQDCPYPDLDGRDAEPDARHFVLVEESAVIGALRLLDDGEWLRIGRVVVAESARGRGLADRLMRAALAEVGDRPVRLDAQTGLAGWYASFGFEATGPEFVEDGIPHLPMARGDAG
jgi:ElaA protein